MSDLLHSYSYPNLGAPGLAPPGKSFILAPLPYYVVEMEAVHPAVYLEYVDLAVEVEDVDLPVTMS